MGKSLSCGCARICPTDPSDDSAHAEAGAAIPDRDCVAETISDVHRGGFLWFTLMKSRGEWDTFPSFLRITLSVIAVAKESVRTDQDSVGDTTNRTRTDTRKRSGFNIRNIVGYCPRCLYSTRYSGVRLVLGLVIATVPCRRCMNRLQN